MTQQQTKGDSEYQRLIANLDLSGLPDNMQDDFIERFSTMLYNAVTTRAVSELNTDQQTEVSEMIEKETDESAGEIFAYFETNLPNFQTTLEEESARIMADLNENTSDKAGKPE